MASALPLNMGKRRLFDKSRSKRGPRVSNDRELPPKVKVSLEESASLVDHCRHPRVCLRIPISAD